MNKENAKQINVGDQIILLQDACLGLLKKGTKGIITQVVRSDGLYEFEVKGVGKGIFSVQEIGTVVDLYEEPKKEESEYNKTFIIDDFQNSILTRKDFNKVFTIIKANPEVTKVLELINFICPCSEKLLEDNPECNENSNCTECVISRLNTYFNTPIPTKSKYSNHIPVLLNSQKSIQNFISALKKINVPVSLSDTHKDPTDLNNLFEVDLTRPFTIVVDTPDEIVLSQVYEAIKPFIYMESKGE